MVTHNFSHSSTAPDAAPTGFRYSVVNGTAIVTLKWSQLPERTTNGDIIFYTLSCSSSSSQPVAWMTAELQLMSNSLSPGTLYQCTVSASTMAGEGPVSQPPLKILTGKQTGMIIKALDHNVLLVYVLIIKPSLFPQFLELQGISYSLL